MTVSIGMSKRRSDWIELNASWTGVRVGQIQTRPAAVTSAVLWYTLNYPNFPKACLETLFQGCNLQLVNGPYSMRYIIYHMLFMESAYIKVNFFVRITIEERFPNLWRVHLSRHNLVAKVFKVFSLQPHTENTDDPILPYLVSHTYQQLAEPIKLESYKPCSNQKEINNR